MVQVFANLVCDVLREYAEIGHRGTPCAVVRSAPGRRGGPVDQVLGFASSHAKLHYAAVVADWHCVLAKDICPIWSRRDGGALDHHVPGSSSVPPPLPPLECRLRTVLVRMSGVRPEAGTCRAPLSSARTPRQIAGGRRPRRWARSAAARGPGRLVAICGAGRSESAALTGFNESELHRCRVATHEGQTCSRH